MCDLSGFADRCMHGSSSSAAQLCGPAASATSADGRVETHSVQIHLCGRDGFLTITSITVIAIRSTIRGITGITTRSTTRSIATTMISILILLLLTPRASCLSAPLRLNTPEAAMIESTMMRHCESLHVRNHAISVYRHFLLSAASSIFLQTCCSFLAGKPLPCNSCFPSSLYSSALFSPLDLFVTSFRHLDVGTCLVNLERLSLRCRRNQEAGGSVLKASEVPTTNSLELSPKP